MTIRKRSWRSGALFAVAVLAGLGDPVLAQAKTPPAGQQAGLPATAAAAQVRIEGPADGAVLSSPFTVRFAIRSMAVRPAGDMSEGTGRHHLLIDEGPMAAGAAIPMTEKHLHSGKGQTEAQITLPPVNYRLTAQFANGAHQSDGPALSHSIRVTVK
jgi:hypothetical protein